MLFLILGYLSCVVLSSQIEFISVVPEQDNPIFMFDLYSIHQAAHYASRFDSKGVAERVYMSTRTRIIGGVLPLTRISFGVSIPEDIPSFQLLNRNDKESYYVSRHFSYSSFDMKQLQPEMLDFEDFDYMPLKVLASKLKTSTFCKVRNLSFAYGMMELPSPPIPLNNPLFLKSRLKRLKNYHHDKLPKGSISFSAIYAMIRYSILKDCCVHNSVKYFRRYWPKSKLKCFIFPKNTEVHLVGQLPSYLPANAPIVLFWDDNSIAPIQALELANPSVVVQLVSDTRSILWLLEFSPEQPDAKACMDLVFPRPIISYLKLFNAVAD